MDISVNSSSICFICNKSECPLRSSQEYGIDTTSFLEIIEKISGFTFQISDDDQSIPEICYKCQEEAIIAYKFQKNCIKAIEDLMTCENEPENSLNIDEFCDDSSIIEYDDSIDYEGTFLEQDEDIEVEQEVIEESVIQEEYHAEDIPKQKEKLQFMQTDDGRYKCLTCDNTFKTKDILRRHSVRHTKGKNFKCLMCPREFFFQRDLNFHNQKSHNSSEKFLCEFCNHEYSSKSALTKHLLIHEDIRQFECTECGKKFRTKFTLNNHELTHTQIKPFECKVDGCSQKFTQKNILIRHMSSSHKMNFYNCEYCKNESFEKHKDLRNHWTSCQSFLNLR